MTPAGKALKERYQAEARYQWGFKKPLAGDVEVSITLYFGTKRRADWDNFHKLSCDALSGIAYEDDSQIKRVTVALSYDKAKPRIELSLSEAKDTPAIISKLTRCAAPRHTPLIRRKCSECVES